jgi:hypothetical protein
LVLSETNLLATLMGNVTCLGFATKSKIAHATHGRTEVLLLVLLYVSRGSDELSTHLHQRLTVFVNVLWHVQRPHSAVRRSSTPLKDGGHHCPRHHYYPASAIVIVSFTTTTIIITIINGQYLPYSVLPRHILALCSP